MRTVGSIQTVSNPSAKTVSETLALLQVVGGGEKGVRKILEELQEVQKHNERVLVEAREAKKEAEQAITESAHVSEEAKKSKAEAIFERDKLREDSRLSDEVLAKKSKALDFREIALAAQKADFEATKKKDLASLEKSENNLTKRIVAIGNRETKCAEETAISEKTRREFAHIGKLITKAL